MKHSLSQSHSHSQSLSLSRSLNQSRNQSLSLSPRWVGATLMFERVLTHAQYADAATLPL